MPMMLGEFALDPINKEIISELFVSELLYVVPQEIRGNPESFGKAIRGYTLVYRRDREVVAYGKPMAIYVFAGIRDTE